MQRILTAQELRAKRALDRLVILSQTRAGSALRECDRYRGVRGSSGEHLRACCGRSGAGRRPWLSADKLELDESLLSGEVGPVPKHADDGCRLQLSRIPAVRASSAQGARIHRDCHCVAHRRRRAVQPLSGSPLESWVVCRPGATAAHASAPLFWCAGTELAAALCGDGYGGTCLTGCGAGRANGRGVAWDGTTGQGWRRWCAVATTATCRARAAQALSFAA